MKPIYKRYYVDCLQRLGGLLLIFCLILSTVSSCKKSFSSSQLTDDKLVVLAEITAGDSMQVPIGKTIKVGNGGIIHFEKVNDATATIRDLSNRTFILSPNWSLQYTFNPTTVFTNRRHIKPNTTYTIEITHPTLGIARATTHIPALPKLTHIDTSAAIYQNKNVLAITISWHDDGLAENYYIIEAVKETVKIARYFLYRGIRYSYDLPAGKSLYEQVKNDPAVKLLKDSIPQNKFTRIHVYTDDVNTDNILVGSMANPFRRIFIQGAIFSGRNYSTKVYLDREFLVATELKYKGRVRLQLKSASKELYNYLLSYEKYKTDFGFVPSSQLVSPQGNIQNGLGIFGGSARRERIMYFDHF